MRDLPQYGAVGDGVADDTAALAAAIEGAFCIPAGAIRGLTVWPTPDEMASAAFAAAVRSVSADFTAAMRDVSEQLASAGTEIAAWVTEASRAVDAASQAAESSARGLARLIALDETFQARIPGRPKRKPPRTCPRHGVVMAGGLCRRCAR